MKNTFLLLLLCLSFSLTAQDAPLDYGMTQDQIELLNLDCLHQRGFTGKGVTVAHLDDGYDGFDKIKAFDYAREQGLVKGNRDFVFGGATKFSDNGSHGTNTLGIVNGYLPGKYIGAAFDANILMAHTEYTPSETHKEEEYWHQAVLWADSMGADIITSSLQYNEFDKGEGNYTYEDMDGNTSIISRAADEAARRGILVVAIQGNFGSQKWHYVTTPGDADSVLTVGAVGADQDKAKFSSFGPSADGQIKPDVMAVGFKTAIINPNGSIRKGNGTSYAAPAVAGMVACLKQAHPQRTNMEIIAAVRQSSDRYLTPDAKEGYGYGIPDACRADEILTEMDAAIQKQGERIVLDAFNYKVYKSKICIKKPKGISSVSLYNAVGEEVRSHSTFKKKISLKKLPKGNYTLHVRLENGETVVENIWL